ncbi:hypothetical protein [Flavobacterium aestivum]|nr:hypothetical protein [Flavobacterium aestivum]
MKLNRLGFKNEAQNNTLRLLHNAKILTTNINVKDIAILLL